MIDGGNRGKKSEISACGQVWEPIDCSSHTSANFAHKYSDSTHNSHCLAPENDVSHWFI